MSVKNVLLLVAILSMTGCAGVSTRNVPLGHENSKLMHDQSLRITQRVTPHFTAATALGYMSGDSPVARGNMLVRVHEIEDPARYIATRLAQDLAFKFGASFVGQTDHVVDSSDNFEIAAMFNNSRYVLDVQTVSWLYVYFPTNWNRYKIIYTGKLRLIDTRTQSILAEGFCSSNPDVEATDSPDEVELLDDSARLLKQILLERAEYCITEFRNNTLDIGSQFASASDLLGLTPAIDSMPKTQDSTLIEPAVNVSVLDLNEPVVAGIDVSGSYGSSITGNLFHTNLRTRSPGVNLVQNGNKISGTFGNNGGTIGGVIKGDTIEFNWYSGTGNGSGQWRVAPGGKRLTGTWFAQSDGDGDWNLDLIKSTSRSIAKSTVTGLSAASPTASNAKVQIDVSGKYSSSITGNLFHTNLRTRSPEVSLVQNGDKITGSFGSGGGKIGGVIKGSTIEFNWYSAIGNGSGQWRVAPGGKRLTGTWFAESDGDGDWNLDLIKSTAPAIAKTPAMDLSDASPEPEPMVDVSGTYDAEVVSNSQWIFRSGFRNFRISLVQKGKEIRVSPVPSGLKVTAKRTGNTISFSTTSNARCGCDYVEGEWKVSGDGKLLKGTWTRSGGGEGEWNLKKIN